MLTYAQAIQQARVDYLRKVLTMTGGNVTQAAKLAGLHRTYMHALLKSSGVRTPDKARAEKIIDGIAESRTATS